MKKTFSTVLTMIAVFVTYMTLMSISYLYITTVFAGYDDSQIVSLSLAAGAIVTMAINMVDNITKRGDPLQRVLKEELAKANAIMEDLSQTNTELRMRISELEATK